MTGPELESLLTGSHVKLHPYVRGHWPPETLYTLWNLMRTQGALRKVFWGGNGATRGDLVDFVKFFEPEPPVTRVLLMAQSQKNPADIAGLMWFDDLVDGRASAGVFFARKYWGHPAREGSRIALAYAFQVLGARTVWAYTPWRIAGRHAEACGFRPVVALPEYAVIAEKPQDLYVLRLTREDFDGRQPH